MKFELKTQNDYSVKSFSNVSKTVCILALIILFCDIALKLRVISRHYQIEYNCRLLSVDKTASNFNKLSKISNLKSRQRIWDFCREVVK